LNPAFVLAENGTEVARAVHVGFWQRSYEIRRRDREPLVMKRAAAWHDDYSCYENGALVGSIKRVGLLQNRTHFEFSDGVDPALKVFLVWMTLAIGREEAASEAVVTG